MLTPLEIIAIEGRTDEGNGVSRPFRCRSESEDLYFVKLKNSGHTQLVKEWIAGRLAQEMGLPIADFRQVKIPIELVAGVPEYESELGHGIAFGSKELAPAKRLAMPFIPSDPNGQLSRILLFDRWIHNSDRALTETGGNPNLLWDISRARVVLIDHDNAFDESFVLKEFWENHALRRFRSAWSAENRPEMTAWLMAGAAHLDRLWDELPEEWLEDSFGDPRSRLDKTALKTVLSCPQTQPDFWNLPPAATP